MKFLEIKCGIKTSKLLVRQRGRTAKVAHFTDSTKIFSTEVALEARDRGAADATKRYT